MKTFILQTLGDVCGLSPLLFKESVVSLLKCGERRPNIEGSIYHSSKAGPLRPRTVERFHHSLAPCIMVLQADDIDGASVTNRLFCDSIGNDAMQAGRLSL